MARSPKIKRQLIFITCFLLAFGSSLAYAKQRPNRHLLSWESLKSRENASRFRQMIKTDRRVSLSRESAVRLKKSSFFNSRPFQFSSPIVLGDMIFIGVDAGFFYGIDANKYKKLWDYKTEGPIQSKAFAEDGAVYFGDTDGYVYSLNTSDGSERWKVSIASPVITAPLVVADRIYFTTESGRLFALQKENGSEIWHTEAIEKSVGFSVSKGSAPVYFKDMILFGNSSGMLLAYNSNGGLVFARQLGDRNTLVYDLDSTPILGSNCVYVSTADQKIFCIDPSKGGSVNWMVDGIGGVNDLTIDGDKLYVTGGGKISLVKQSDGQLIWEQDFETPEISAPAVGDNVVAVVSTKDKLYLVDPTTGDMLCGRYVRKGSFGDPVFVKDRLVVLSNVGKLYSYKIKEKPPKKPRKKSSR